jgi:hypothetical protein
MSQKPSCFHDSDFSKRATGVNVKARAEYVPAGAIKRGDPSC